MPFPEPTGRDYYDADDDSDPSDAAGCFLLGLVIALAVGLAYWL